VGIQQDIVNHNSDCDISHAIVNGHQVRDNFNYSEWIKINGGEKYVEDCLSLIVPVINFFPLFDNIKGQYMGVTAPYGFIQMF
jgi:hypothetical protein